MHKNIRYRDSNIINSGPLPCCPFVDVSKDTEEKDNVSFCYKLSLTTTMDVILSRNQKSDVMQSSPVFKINNQENPKNLPKSHIKSLIMQ